MEVPTKAEDHSVSLPSLTVNGSSLPLPLATANQHHVTLSSVPRLRLSSRKPSRRHLRPSTAPATDERTDILPSVPSGLSLAEISSGLAHTDLHASDKVSRTSGMSEEEHEPYAPIVSFHEEASRPDLGLLPSPFNTNSREDVVSDGDGRTESTESYCDWATFISAYASGRWDPRRTPNPPRSYLVPPYLYAPQKSTSQSEMSESPAESDLPEELPRQSHTALATVKESSESPPDSSTTSLSSSAPLSLKLPPPTHRMRNSFADLRSSTHTSTSTLPLSLDAMPYAPPSLSPDITTAAATMRWAAARVNLAPLALPSPEHELTDPMRGLMTAIPGAHTPRPQGSEPPTPGGTRKPRLPSFWQGTQDVEENHRSRLSTIEGSPTSSQEDERIARHTLPLPASAPLIHVSDKPAGDYFGDAEEQALASFRETPSQTRRVLTAPIESGASSVPALPRRVCLTRQTSSPLPGSSVPSTIEQRLPGGRVASESITSVKAGRAAKEEQMFAELGYLAPPNPPDELERRRALYKFNIWSTGPDLNFDRIAHLAKLVFNTKGVFISLIDGNEQWFKSEWGMKNPSLARIHSFCAHTILQRGDEPMVVLDASQDWRFAKNPLVTGLPNIRFYAGAPLRTQDGFNIGSLTVVDDSPRGDFTPRQRHTLKEFAAIAMREMELWRDKIQLRIRDRIQNSMEQFSRECLEIDTDAQAQNKEDRPDLIVGASMDKVYDRAAKLVKRTLDVEGVVVMDVSHCEVLETMSTEGSVSIVMHHGDLQKETTTRALSSDEYQKLNAFFARHPDGKISEGIVPPSLRPFLPTHIQYALTVPIFNIDKRPFALLCAYNASDHTKRFLEGHELSYMRAIGVIILSAVLKRRMTLADKAKSLFISNISHELRTPLHGILAAAELLSDTPLNHSQISFLQTVQACGTSLVETVNHVLDFTKLSGNAKSGGVDHVIIPSKVDLMQLVEEAVDGCWIGHRARTSVLRHSEIGSVYSPQQDGHPAVVSPPTESHVETVVDIGRRNAGWNVIFEKAGMRRVLMNLFGNSLKFTSTGYVHVNLRELPRTEDTPPNKIKIELSVLDTGKGISQNFLKNQLFHPFSQENPLQTGTGLGLAIVNSIVQSESVGGKVDVWSEEGVGTEIRIHFQAEIPEDGDETLGESSPMRLDNATYPPTISLVGFNHMDRGTHLLHGVLCTYLASWWGFNIRSEGSEYGDIVIVNEDPSVVVVATERRDTSRPFIILSASRGNPTIMAIASEYERVGGFCRILYKPGGPSRLRAVLKLCLHVLKIGKKSQVPSPHDPQGFRSSDLNGVECSCGRDFDDYSGPTSQLPRRNSDITDVWYRPPPRPSMTPRAATVNPLAGSWGVPSTTPERDEVEPDEEHNPPAPEKSLARHTISVGNGGTLLKSSVGTIDTRQRNFRVLVVEDNSILRTLLAKWLSNKGIEFRDAVDGRDGVSVYQSEGPFDVVLLDLSMPVLDGVGATAEIRQIESSRVETSSQESASQKSSARILALTGMSSLEDKRRAFEAGVDGYLVKPVAFKTLDEMFHKLGVS